MAAPGPKTSAAGPAGVAAAARIALREAGPLRSAQLLLRANQPAGFDCPGCAWPEADRPHRAEFCENGAKAIVWEATRKRADADFFARHSIADLAGRDDHWLESAGRIAEPMHRAPGDTHYRPIGWDQAFAVVARHLRGLGDPDRAVFYTSGRTSNEAAFLYQLFVRRYGTNNLPDCSNLCHESSGTALMQTIGVGKGTVTLQDFSEHADLIVILGANPGTNHPRMLVALEEAKRRGAQIVVVNPLPEAGLIRFRNPQRARGLAGRGTPLADQHLQVRLNGDLALMTYLNKHLVASGNIDEGFIERFTEGFGEAAKAWRAADGNELLAAAGIGAAEAGELLDRVVGAQRIIAAWTMGLTQHRNAVATIREVVNFLLLRGSLGRPGAGACPIRGHSNVQGDRTMGINERPPAAFLDALQRRYGFAPPRRHGHDVVAAIGALRDGRARVFVGLGGNFAAAAPDTRTTHQALERAELTVSVSTRLNRTHARAGRESLILPTMGRTERDRDQTVTVEDSMSRVKPSRGRLEPASPQLRSEPWIVAQMARAVLGDGSIPWSQYAVDYGAVRRDISHVVDGFDRFRTGEAAAFALANAPRDDRRFPTPTGSARFTVNPVVPVTVPAGHLLLQTLRSHDQFNTTVYGLDDRYRGIKGRRDVVLVNPGDMARLGLVADDRVDVVSVAPDGERVLPGLSVVAYPTAAGCAATYFPEANVLVPLDSVAEGSRTPTSKSIVVRLVPVGRA